MSKVAKPLVSIGLPVFLGEKFLRESLPKICRQSYENIEIIVIDDNSSDKSLEICKMMYKRFKNFKLLSNKKNLGAIDNFKKTLFLSKGDFFCWACQDDFFDKKFIEKQVDIFTKNKNIVATLPSWDLVDSKNNIISTFTYENFKLPQDQSKFANALNLFRSRKINGTREKNNMFIHGLIKTKLLKEITTSYDGIIQSDRVSVFFLALFGKLFFIEETLWKRTDRGPILDRKDRIKDPLWIERKQGKYTFYNNIKTLISITFNCRSMNLFKQFFSLCLIFIIILIRLKINLLNNLSSIVKKLTNIKLV